jgi:hypothetical protein
MLTAGNPWQPCSPLPSPRPQDLKLQPLLLEQLDSSYDVVLCDSRLQRPLLTAHLSVNTTTLLAGLCTCQTIVTLTARPELIVAHHPSCRT